MKNQYHVATAFLYTVYPPTSMHCCDYYLPSFVYAIALTYFLTKATAGDDPQCSEAVQSFVRTYLDIYPDCQHILAPLELEREKRSQDLVC